MPLRNTCSKAISAVAPVHPPIPPQCMGFGAHDTICCSDSSKSTSVCIAMCDSKTAVDANAQQDPHMPWFLTGVVTPFVRQSTAAGRLETGSIVIGRDAVVNMRLVAME